ncbi:MAG: 16S rRNA (cytosine(1402)-N(4))-methyltransferase RsmH [Chlorobiaceae bacterium]|nr:16S rRNA (cytosine(1402)-N(4))-methyltransferase RsmH [Chlorobiaceae bacterium]NTW09970.1 16S rRNA (cytosine(1402)-N(4))-methyltransferase RsmH [Chlorobiaceae bacterium]
MGEEFHHEPVLAAEIVGMLARKPGIYVDGTLGGGGHASALAEALFGMGCLERSLIIGIDQDDDALRAAAEKMTPWKANTVLVKGNFGDLDTLFRGVCSDKNMVPEAAGILLDLGVSSYQIDSASRGFSYLREGPLDMRMDKGATLTAADIVNTYDEKVLARVLFRYGEEKRSRSIAKTIVAYRAKNGPISGTEELAGIVRGLAHGGENVIKMLSRVFQALRIEVNDELEVLRDALVQGIGCLAEHGRMAVISYHSLEDRIVKNVFAEYSRNDWGPKGVGLREPLTRAAVSLVNRKPLLAAEDEIAMNPRARSAKLRVIQKNSTGGSCEC